MQNNIISLSGGKDSTAMLHLMLDQNIPIHSVIFCDTGWEFSDMLDHIDLVEQKTGIKIVRVKPEKSFNHWMLRQPVIARKGPMKGKVHRIGNGWPSLGRRWCTREKISAIHKFTKNIENMVEAIGYAYDEKHRVKDNKKYSTIYPLIDAKMTEADCLDYCKKLGYHWGGLYDRFARVSCFCCPLQRIGELRKLREYYPELWAKTLKWDDHEKNRGFKGYATAHDLDTRFEKEDRQLRLF